MSEESLRLYHLSRELWDRAAMLRDAEDPGSVEVFLEAFSTARTAAEGVAAGHEQAKSILWLHAGSVALDASLHGEAFECADLGLAGSPDQRTRAHLEELRGFARAGQLGRYLKNSKRTR